MSMHQDSRKTVSGLIANLGSPIRLRRHHYIVRRGERPDNVLLLQEGWAARYKLLPDGRRHISQFYMPGDLCDLSWLVSGEAGQAVAALTPIRAIAAEREMVEEHLGSNAGFSRCVAADALIRLEAQAEWMVTLGCRSAIERLGQLICELYLRLERAGRAENLKCDFPLSQQHLADFTGMSSIHVCRTLRRMKRAKLLDLKRRSLSILDFASLIRSCAFSGSYLEEDARPGSKLLAAA